MSTLRCPKCKVELDDLYLTCHSCNTYEHLSKWKAPCSSCLELKKKLATKGELTGKKPVQCRFCYKPTPIPWRSQLELRELQNGILPICSECKKSRV